MNAGSLFSPAKRGLPWVPSPQGSSSTHFHPGTGQGLEEDRLQGPASKVLEVAADGIIYILIREGA